MMRRFLPLILLLLSACALVPPLTAARLAALDPLTADPGGITVALVLPPGIEVTPDTAVLLLQARRGSETRQGRFKLEPRPTDGIAPPPGAAVRAFGLSATDTATMRGLQAQILAWKAEGTATGSLSVGVGACAIGDGPAPDARGAALIRLATGEPFRPLIGDAPLADLIGADGLATIGACPASP